MFAYCNNNPCSNIDANGYALKSVLDSDSNMVAAIVSIGLINAFVNKIKETIIDDTDWENSDKNHILKGTNKKHIEGWKRFGFDPEDPENWSKVVLILTSIVNNNEPFKIGNARGGGTITYYAEVFTEIGVKVVVKIWTSADGLIQKLSDAIPYIFDGN